MPAGWAAPLHHRHAGDTPSPRSGTRKNFGATVLVEGRDLNEAAPWPQRLKAEQHLALRPPFRRSACHCRAGNGGAEMMEEFPDLDALIMPVGGGGLIAGIARGRTSAQARH